LVVLKMESTDMICSFGSQSVEACAWVYFAGDTQISGVRAIHNFALCARYRRFGYLYQGADMPPETQGRTKRQKTHHGSTPTAAAAITPGTGRSWSIFSPLGAVSTARRAIFGDTTNPNPSEDSTAVAPAPAPVADVAAPASAPVADATAGDRGDIVHGHAKLKSPVKFGASVPISRQPKMQFICPFVVPPGWDDVATADNRGVRRPRIDLVFPHTLCPYTNRPFYELVDYGYHTFIEFMNIKFSRKITDASKDSLSYDHTNYTQSCLTSIAVLLVHGIANGFSSTAGRPGNSLATFKELFPDREDHYRDCMYNVMVYLFKYGVPAHLWSTLWSEAEGKSVVTAKQTFLGHRCKFKLWSSQYADQVVVGALGQTDKNFCKGHNYQIALIFDRLVPRRSECSIAKNRPDGHHYLTAKQLKKWFSVNKNKCFWDNSSHTQPTRLAPGIEM
jgi:hypothetical protein